MSNDICAIEKRIVQSTIRDLLAAGFTVSVNDGEETTLHHSSDPAAILAAMFTTDEDYLRAYNADSDDCPAGWVRFIYGNDGWDVINDYSTELEDILAPTNALADRIDELGYATVLEEEKAALIALIENVRPHVAPWIGLFTAFVEAQPPDISPTQENPDGRSDRSYAEHELRAMKRDLTALCANLSGDANPSAAASSAKPALAAAGMKVAMTKEQMKQALYGLRMRRLYVETNGVFEGDVLAEINAIVDLEIELQAILSGVPR